MDRLVVNPTLVGSLSVSTRVRGQGRLRTTCTLRGEGLSLVRAIIEAIESRSGRIPSPRQSRHLRKAGILVALRDVPEVTMPRFKAHLGLVAGRPLPEAGTADDERSMLVPGRIVRRARPPFQEDLSSNRPVIWVRTALGMTLPVWPDAHFQKVVASILRSGRLPAKGPELECLRLAGVVAGRAAIRHWEVERKRAARDLRRAHYAVLRSVLPALHLDNYQRHTASLHHEGYFCHGDEQVPLRDVIHNELASRFLHHQLVPLISELTGERVKASYNYLVRYRPGAELKRHLDRPQCAWNVSLVVDAPEAAPPRSLWPICFEVGGRQAKAFLRPGDMVIYRGTDVPHWRPRLGGTRPVTVCLFHFVSDNFRGTLD